MRKMKLLMFEMQLSLREQVWTDEAGKLENYSFFDGLFFSEIEATQSRPSESTGKVRRNWRRGSTRSHQAGRRWTDVDTMLVTTSSFICSEEQWENALTVNKFHMVPNRESKTGIKQKTHDDEPLTLL